MSEHQLELKFKKTSRLKSPNFDSSLLGEIGALYELLETISYYT